ncbi:MAG: hypothetical protein OXC93_13995 [Rhodospirillaceae bacterium]|nr:hypothetical protein [Rhodospirillaceae bacterium]
MKGTGYWAMTGCVVVFSIFLANVVTWTLGATAFLSDVGEMLLLFAACIAFVILVLQREGAEKQ